MRSRCLLHRGNDELGAVGHPGARRGDLSDLRVADARLASFRDQYGAVGERLLREEHPVYRHGRGAWRDRPGCAVAAGYRPRPHPSGRARPHRSDVGCRRHAPQTERRSVRAVPGARAAVSHRRLGAVVEDLQSTSQRDGMTRLWVGGRKMLEKLVYVSVFVKDQQRALDFYTNLLGFEKRVDVPYPDGTRFLTVGLKGQEFELVLWPGTPGQAPPFQGRIPAQYTIATEDCRKEFEVLKSRGVRFETDVLEFPWGSIAVFLD